MIDTVTIDGLELDVLDVVAAITIRHGRTSADDGPLASSASIRLINQLRADVVDFETEVELRILDGDVPRFVGTITDAALNEDGLSLTAVSSLARASEKSIGADDWPEESWSSRVRRVFAEAGFGNTWENMVGTWADQPVGETWAVPFAFPHITIEVGDTDPILVARAADPTTVSAYLSTLLADVAAAIANLPDGSILVQALEARKDRLEVAIAADTIAAFPEWSKVSDVENVATVTYGDPELETTATDEASVERYDEQAVTLSTDLRDEADASARAREHVYRYGVSDWLVESLEILDGADYAALTIGDPAAFDSLPEWAPYAERVGMVEGWTDAIDVHAATGELEWTITLALSSPRLSGVGQDWASIPAGEQWADVAAGVTWSRPDSVFNS